MDFKKYFNRINLSSFLIIVLLIGILSFKTEASTHTYNVHYLSEVNRQVDFGPSLLETTDFQEAKELMLKDPNGVITSDKSPSPLKIVAASRGQAQAYPYRTGKDKAGVTLNIYSNNNLTTAHTYIAAHYLMYVYDFQEVANRIVANVEIQGGRGFVEVDKTDIIPMIYIEKGLNIEIGGNENYYKTPEKSYTILPQQETYTVKKNGSINEMTIRSVRPHPNLSNVEMTYAIAPNDLSEGTYYSPDGIRFYKDRELKERVGKDYYAYFQWLPLRSMTNHGADSFEKLLKELGKTNSVMLGKTGSFIEEGLKYGMNPVYIFQQANLESAYGTSKYALDRNNLFGWGAVDSDPNKALSYDNIGQGIAIHMSSQIAGYMSVNDWRHYGASFGNKGAGITVKYASDPYYGVKVASLYYRMDKLNGFKDYNAYNLSLLKDRTVYSVKKDKSTSDEWYKTRSGLENQLIINLGKEGARIKTTLWMPNFEGVSYAGTFPLNLFEEFGYIEASGITDVVLHGSKGSLPQPPKGWTPPKKELAYEEAVDAMTTSNVNLRKSVSTSSTVLATIPKDTRLVVERTNIGWARTSYKGQTGYISMDYIKIEEKPVDPGSGDKIITEGIGGKLKGNIVTGLKLDTSLAKVRENILKLDKDASLVAYDRAGKEKIATSNLFTGDSLKITLGDGKVIEHKLAVAGDINGDGKINSADYVQIANHILGKKVAKDAELVAMDINGNDTVNSADFVAVANHILGKKPIH